MRFLADGGSEVHAIVETWDAAKKIADELNAANQAEETRSAAVADAHIAALVLRHAAMLVGDRDATRLPPEAREVLWEAAREFIEASGGTII